METLQEIIGVLRNVGVAIGGITLIILLIKMTTEPDDKAKYIKLIKNTIIASILITISLTLLQIPKDFFGEAVGIADEGTGDITFAKIEDKDCQGRETVNIDGKRYVVTDTEKKIAALTDDEVLHEAFGIYSTGKVVENVCYLRPFNDCQGFWKGFYADIEYYRDSDGFIFPSTFTYSEYTAHKGQGRDFINNGRCWSVVLVEVVVDEKKCKNTITN